RRVRAASAYLGRLALTRSRLRRLLYGLEVGLVADAARGAVPAGGHRRPPRAGRQALPLVTRALVVDVGAARASEAPGRGRTLTAGLVTGGPGRGRGPRAALARGDTMRPDVHLGHVSAVV